jgi:hypothetical protein
MAHYPDLERCTYFDPEYDDDALVAVGWLEPGHDFRRGSVDLQFFERLESLAKRTWGPIFYLGGHECELCQHRGAISTGYLLVPFGGRIFAAPEGITHYISAHWYRPPDEFVQAVTACPEMRSAEYGHALATNGGRQLAQAFDPHWDDEFRDSLPSPESCAIGGCMFLQ